MTKNQGEIFDAEKIMPPVFQFVSNDFNSAWENAIRNVLMTGKQIVFGGPGETKKDHRYGPNNSAELQCSKSDTGETDTSKISIQNGRPIYKRIHARVSGRAS